jgi:mxaD protein
MQKIQALLKVSTLTFVLTPAYAHGPTPIKVEESVHVDADPVKVWALVKDFKGISSWHPEVKAVAGKAGHEPGTERTLTMANGEKITESLDDYNEQEMQYAYRSAKENVKALPASSYSLRFGVKAGADGGSDVAWAGRVYRGDTGNEPPANLNDDAAKSRMSEFFRAGLESIKNKAGKK